MTADQTPETDEAEAVEEAGESGAMSERTAKIILAVVAAGAVWGLVSAFPWIAYIAVGSGLTLGWQRVRSWRRGPSSDDGQDGEQEPESPDICEALRRLVSDDKGVLLTVLRDDLGLPDTKAVKALLKAAGIPWKPVRTRDGNGPAVHRHDIPADPSPVASRPHGDGCCCRSGDNDNANNSEEETPEEGVRVETFGPGGYIIRDPKDSVRHHRVT